MDESTEFEKQFAEAAAQLKGPPPEGEVKEAEPTESTAAPAPDAAAPAPQDAAPAQPANEAPAPEVKPPTIEDLMARLSEVERRERASASRASQVARENNRLMDELRQLRPKPAAAPAAEPEPEPEDDPLKAAPDLQASIKRLIKAEVAPLANKAEEASQIAGQVKQAVAPIQESAYKAEIAKTHAALDEKFGKTWKETVTSPVYDEWLEKQPSWVRDLADKAIGFEDSATVLGRFYATHGFPTKQPTPETPANTPAPAAGNDPQARLRAAAGIPTRSVARPAPQGPTEDDFEGNFAAAVAQLKRA